MPFVSISSADAAARVAEGTLLVLDVRTPDEFTALGHIPGARLLPVQCIASAPAVVPRGRGPILVCCEHGVRSRHAADVLVRAGYRDVLNLEHGMAAWTGPRAFDAAPIWGPAAWVLENADLYAGQSRVLDVACGKGRHALLFAAAGFTVEAVDRDADALAALSATAEALGLAVRVRHGDLEQPDVNLGAGAFDVIVVTNYLHRPLFPVLHRALAVRGLLVYDTFTTAQAALPDGPSNPAFLLEPGELRTLVATLDVLREREGLVDGQHRAGVVARRV
jgi:rhodanese-related sulfurtransferase